MGFRRRKLMNVLQMRNPVVPKESVYRTLDRVDDVSRNPAFNPDGKTLTLEQRVRLAKLVDEQNNQFQNAGDVHRDEHVDASLSALKSNQYVCIEMGATAAENQQKQKPKQKKPKQATKARERDDDESSADEDQALGGRANRALIATARPSRALLVAWRPAGSTFWASNFTHACGVDDVSALRS